MKLHQTTSPQREWGIRRLLLPLLVCLLAMMAGQSRAQDGTVNGHGYVDLGLSVKWATCNVGASSPSGYGNYYAWGETSTKSSYTSDNYKYDLGWVGSQDIGGDISGTEYDAARANWGAAWRMPTLDELKELEEKCTWTWTSQDGHYGYRVTGPNGKSIFLPAAGYYDDGGLHHESEGLYWSSVVDYYWDYYFEVEVLDCNFAHILAISNSGIDLSSTELREYGLPIRPVIDAGSTASTSTTSRPAVTSTSTTTSTTTVVTVSPKGYADFFPVYGVLLGKTTVSDVKALGYIAKSDGDDYKAYIQTLTFWDFDGNGVFKDIYMVKNNAMPDKWRELGLDWKLSYDEWLALFQRMDFSIEHTEAPETTEYSGRNTLSAEFIAMAPDQTFTMELDFNYGNEHGEGYSTRSKRSLYSISVKLKNKPSVFPVNDARALSVASVPAVRRYFSDFFPVYGVAIGRSTISDVKALDYAVEEEKCAYVEGLTFWNHNGDQIFEHLYVTNGDPMPEKWQRLGLDWRLSYDEWLALFKKMGFAIEHARSPGTEYNALSAEFVATAPDGSFTMRMNFNYGNQNGEGRRTSSRNSLYSITMDTE